MDLSPEVLLFSISELALLTTLAIRNLSNLRFKGREEYVMPILKKGLDDFSPTVRKACLMGMTKLINEANRKTAEPVRDE